MPPEPERWKKTFLSLTGARLHPNITVIIYILRRYYGKRREKSKNKEIVKIIFLSGFRESFGTG